MTERVVEIGAGDPGREGFVLVRRAGAEILLVLSLRRGGDVELRLTAAECGKVIDALREATETETKRV